MAFSKIKRLLPNQCTIIQTISVPRICQVYYRLDKLFEIVNITHDILKVETKYIYMYLPSSIFRIRITHIHACSFSSISRILCIVFLFFVFFFLGCCRLLEVAVSLVRQYLSRQLLGSSSPHRRVEPSEQSGFLGSALCVASRRSPVLSPAMRSSTWPAAGYKLV